MKTQLSKFKKVLAVALLLALLASLAALPATGSHECTEGSDDYDQCVASKGSHDDESAGGSWYNDAPCDNVPDNDIADCPARN